MIFEHTFFYKTNNFNHMNDCYSCHDIIQRIYEYKSFTNKISI